MSSEPMSYVQERQSKKFFAGISIRTSNERFLKEAPSLWDRFYRENISDKISNRLNDNLLAVYTDYEGDYSQPFTYLIGYEISSLNSLPEGVVGIEVASSPYAVFIADGEFPQSLQTTWQTIWRMDLKRSYQSDFEVYPPHFNPQNNSEIKVYIGITEDAQ